MVPNKGIFYSSNLISMFLIENVSITVKKGIFVSTWYNSADRYITVVTTQNCPILCIRDEVSLVGDYFHYHFWMQSC